MPKSLVKVQVWLADGGSDERLDLSRYQGAAMTTEERDEAEERFLEDCVIAIQNVIRKERRGG